MRRDFDEELNNTAVAEPPIRDNPQVPEREEYVIQTQFDLIVTPGISESLVDAVGRALRVYKYETGFKVVSCTHKSYIPTKE